MEGEKQREPHTVISGLVSYAEGAGATRAEPGLFGEAERVRPEDILKSTLEKLDGKDTAPAQGSLLADGRQPSGESATPDRQEGQRPVGENGSVEATEPVRQEVKAPLEESVGPTPSQEGVSIADIHALADSKNIPWDNDPEFKKFTKSVTGKEHLDDLSPLQRKVLYKKLEKRAALEKPAVTQPEAVKETAVEEALKVVKETDKVDKTETEKSGLTAMGIRTLERELENAKQIVAKSGNVRLLEQAQARLDAAKGQATAAPTPEAAPTGDLFAQPANTLSAADLLRAAASKMDEVDNKPAKVDKAVVEPAAKTEAVPKESAVSSISAAHDALMERLADGTATIEEYRQQFEQVVANEQAIIAELSGKTKDQLLKQGGNMFAYRYKNDKKDKIIGSIYNNMLDDYVLGDSLSYVINSSGYKTSHLNAIRKIVEDATPESLAAYAEKVKSARAERQQKMAGMLEAVKDPKTLDDFETFLRVKKRVDLTQEQRVRYDELRAEKSRSERAANRTRERTTVRAAGALTGAQIIATKHTRDGYDLFVVQAAERVERDVYNEWNAAAKKLGGWYSSYRGNGATPGFQFKTRESAEAFQKYVSAGDTTAVQEQAQIRRDVFADDRSQTAVERLREMADRLDGRADESLEQDRKVNTARRARMAAGAEAAANYQKSLAATMRNIAQAIEDGKAKFLDQVRQKVQVEMLNGFVTSAKYRELREKYKDYGDQEKHKYDKPTAETIEHAEWPTYTAYRSDLAALGRALLEVDGLKQIGQRILKVADDVTDTYTKFAKENLHKVATYHTKDGGLPGYSTSAAAESAIARSLYNGKAIPLQVKRGQHTIVMSPSEAQRRGMWEGDGDKSITLAPELGAEIVERAARRRLSVPHQFESVHEKRKRFAAMGIETPAEFRSALREFIAAREAPPAPDKVKEMERAMIGRRQDDLDFFPTPANVADDMILAAEIKDGMSILEPSAGMGHIAERIREAGFEPDVAELSGDRRELLEAKGFNVAGRNFLDMTDASYDRIIMNPPFSDRRDMQHIQHAYNLLKPDGRVVAIMGEGVFFGSDKKATDFRAWLERVGGTDEKLSEGSFLDSSLPVNTGVNARMVVIDKRAETGKDVEMYSRRLWREGEENQAEDQRDKQDYIVPETPEFDGNETGDLAYTPRSAQPKGIDQLPIRLTVGEARTAHRGFGVMHLAQEGDSDVRRKAPAATNDDAENYARHVAMIAKTFDEIYTEGGRVILRSARMNEAAVTEKVVDEETGESYYSIVTVVPSRRPVWGNPVWRAGRALLPTDRTLKPGAPLSPDRTSQQSGHKTLGTVQTEHFDLSKERERLQGRRAGKDVSVTVKKRRVFRAKDDPQFSRRQIGSDDRIFYSRDRATSGLPVSVLRAHISKAIESLTVPVKLYDTVAAARADGVETPDDAKGFSADGRMGLIAGNIPDRLAAEFAMWHEVQHLGIRALNKSSDAYEAYRSYQATLSKVAMANPNVRQSAAEWRAKHGQEKTEQFRALGLDGAALEEAVRIASWDEAIADMAGDLRGKPIKFLNELIAALQRLLRALGFENLAEWAEGKTDAEVLSLIRESTKAVTKEAGTGTPTGADVPAYSQANQTDTPAFRAWFGNSKAVDENGKPLVAYHGTSYDISVFKTVGGRGVEPFGSFFTTSQKAASSYAKNSGESGNVLPVYLSIKNPYTVTAKQWGEARGLTLQQAEKKGYDGYIIKNHGGIDERVKGDTYIAFAPEQIKSELPPKFRLPRVT